MQTDTRNVYKCCCCGNQGQCTIVTQFEKDTYAPTENCRAVADLNNSACTVPITNLQIILTQFMRLYSNDGKQHDEQRVLEQKDFPGLGAGEQTGGLNRFLELSLATIKNQCKPRSDGRDYKPDDVFTAEHLQPTTSGKQVQVWYTLKVNCNYDNMCAENPNCTIPLTICPP